MKYSDYLPITDTIQSLSLLDKIAKIKHLERYILRSLGSLLDKA